MNICQAIRYFEESAKSVGLQTTPFSIGGAGNRVSLVRADAAELRLMVREEVGIVRLEITHGPSNGEQLGWVLLYGAPCVGGILQEPLEEDEQFRSAVLFGLELMKPEG